MEPKNDNNRIDNQTPANDNAPDSKGPLYPPERVDMLLALAGYDRNAIPHDDRKLALHHGAFVAGASELVTVPLHAEIHGSAFTLMVHSALITFDHVDPVTGANGVLAGVLDVQELTDVLRGVIARVSTSLCGAAFDGIAEQIASGSDIFMDRTNAPGAPCTGVSFAIGFHARRIANPTMIATPKTFVDPCAPPSDAGTD